MVSTLSSKGVDPANFFVVIGPAISQKNYEVDEQVIDHVDQSLQERTVIQKENDRFLLDLKQLNVEILLQCGVIRSNIEVSNYCTYTDKEMFFSHRRDAGKTGRMLAFIGYTTRRYRVGNVGMEDVATNLEMIRRNIAKTCKKSNRNPDDITIIGVTKYSTIERTKEALEVGVMHLGENRTDELLHKYNQLGDVNASIHWHFIGTLQSRKVKDIVNEV